MSSRRLPGFLWSLTVVFLLSGIGGGGLFWLSQSGLVAVEEIEIYGNRVTDTGQILEKVGPLLKGQSLLSRSFGAAEQELGSFPYFESFELDRDFPSTIRIYIREYRPFACLKGAGERFYLISNDGKVLSGLDKPDSRYPVLLTREPCAAAIGAAAGCQDVNAGVQFLANIPVIFNYEFAEVTVAGEDITAKTRNGVNVRFGSLEDYGLKFEVLRQLMARSVAAGTTITIDVTVPDRPVTRQEG